MKCKCKEPVYINVAGEGFICKDCGGWIIKRRHIWLPERIVTKEDKKKYNRQKEKKIENE